jgi:hypothetical protein
MTTFEQQIALIQEATADLKADNDKAEQMARRREARRRQDAVLKGYLNAVAETVVKLKQNRTFYYD